MSIFSGLYTSRTRHAGVDAILERKKLREVTKVPTVRTVHTTSVPFPFSRRYAKLKPTFQLNDTTEQYSKYPKKNNVHLNRYFCAQVVRFLVRMQNEVGRPRLCLFSTHEYAR